MNKFIFPAKYSDKNGIVKTGIINDSKELSIIIRDVEFIGTDFDGFEPIEGTPSDKLEKFTFDNSNTLIGFELECDIPIKLGKDNKIISSILKMKFNLGELMPNGRIDQEILKLELMFGDKKIQSRGKSGWFEDEMLDIQKQLPTDYFLKCCFGCLFSDYFVAGHGLFGSMFCFRDIKQEYLAVKTKREYLEIMDKKTEIVQEIYLCSQFERRIPGTGYRG